MAGDPDWDFSQPWYHGAQQPLSELRAGSSITQDIAVARVFSHRPTLVAQPGTGEMKHDGVDPGYLYIVAEEITPEDAYPHPHPINTSRWEWLTTRPLPVLLVEQTIVRDEERLTTEEVASLRRRQEAARATGSVVLRDE